MKERMKTEDERLMAQLYVSIEGHMVQLSVCVCAHTRVFIDALHLIFYAHISLILTVHEKYYLWFRDICICSTYLALRFLFFTFRHCFCGCKSRSARENLDDLTLSRATLITPAP